MSRDIAVVVGTCLLAAIVIIIDLHHAGVLDLVFAHPAVHIVRAP